MKNPFKFGSVVDDPYFTDRTEELAEIQAFYPLTSRPAIVTP